MAKSHSEKNESPEARKQNLRTRTPAAQFTNDAATWQTYLNANPTGKRQAILKRLFLTMADGDLQYRTNGMTKFTSIAEDNKKLADGQQLNLAAILSHGGRVVIQIPPVKPGEDKNQFLHWVLGGKNEVGFLDSKDKPVMQRLAATHALKLKDDRLTEIHVKSKVSSLPIIGSGILHLKHMGINLGLGTEQQAAPEDGSHGHLYLYWQAPTHNKPGGLMIGCEGSEPGREDQFGNKHDMKAKSSEFSPTGGQKFRYLDTPLKPAQFDGLRLALKQNELTDLMKKNANDFHVEKLDEPILPQKQMQQQSVTRQQEANRYANLSSKVAKELGRDVKPLDPKFAKKLQFEEQAFEKRQQHENNNIEVKVPTKKHRGP